MLNKYALVLTSIKGIGVRTFSYIIPPELKPVIKIGQAVLVPFGKMGLINAFVVGFSNYLPENIKAKSIVEILEETELFDIEYLKFLEWVAGYYFCEIQTVLECAIPMKFLKMTQRTVKKIATPQTASAEENAILNNLGEKAISVQTLRKKTKLPPTKFYAALRRLKNYLLIENQLENSTQKEQTQKYVKFKHLDGATKRQKEILELLKEEEQMQLSALKDKAATTDATIKKLAETGYIEIFEEKVYRNPLEIFKQNNTEEFPQLLEEQKEVYKEIESRLENHSTILIHGVTSSGKTEVYFHAMKKVLEMGKNVLFLAPEIALASMLTQRIARRFGTEKTAIWHSSISDGEKYDVWQKIKNNEIRILAGARSAVFAPLKNIGLIIIDEEHESSYKQTMPQPRYDARQVAKKLGELHNAPVLSGSATPDINSYYQALNTGNLLVMKKRYQNSPLAKVHIIDMREEHFRANHGIFSRALISAIENNLKDKKQTILLMNRRGFSTYTQCLSCGKVIECPKCAIPLVFHSQTQTLKCHYCEHEQQLPEECPECGGILRNCGTGVQRVELVAQKLFPDCRIERLDSDSLAKKNKHIEILDEFARGEIDILIGTQMLAKGLDNPNVTLVGVINADNSFNLPDFRSCERGFQLLTQVAGRAGRGQYRGDVYFQTYNPEFFALENAKEQDYESFYRTEIEARENFDYPPFSRIIRVVLSSKNQFRAEKSAMEIAMRLRTIIDERNLTEPIAVLGPAPCIIERLQEYYRFQILIKNKLSTKGHTFIHTFLTNIKLPQDIKITIDVDPIDIL